MGSGLNALLGKEVEMVKYTLRVLTAFFLLVTACGLIGAGAAVGDEIIDNGDPKTAFTGTWGVSGGTNPYDPVDPSATALWSRDGATYTWTFTPTETGSHEVLMWWTAYASRANNIPVTIENAVQTATVPVNQQAGGGQWNSLGVYTFEAGVSYDVTITAAPGGSANYSTCADAVQMKYRPDVNVPPTAVIDAVEPRAARPEQFIGFQGHGIDGDGAVETYEWRSDLDGVIGNQPSFTSDALTPGTHTIFFRVQDDQGIWSQPAATLVVVRDCAKPVSIMPLGDSITYGLGEISDQNLITGYREPLFRLLADAGYYFDLVGERSTGLYVTPPFDIHHQGIPGITDAEVAAGIYNRLTAYPAEIVLLHIGTNALTPDPGDVERILDEIDRYEADNDVEVAVVLARIINREISHLDTTLFNDNVAAMAEARIAQGDKILQVDMESALNYAVDMWDLVHPLNVGYVKMAGKWMGILSRLLPTCAEFPPFIYSSPVTTATAGMEFRYPVGALGSPAPTFSLTTSPPGMAIDAGTGEITWVPTPAQDGVHDVTVAAANTLGNTVQHFNVDAAAAIIIDNGDPGTAFTGSWPASGGENPYDPSDANATSLWSRDGSTYTWTFTPQASGTYDIAMWWTAFTSRASSIPVTIENAVQTATVQVNQQANGGQWNSLGVYTFEAGKSYDITITAVPGGSANYSTCADAVKIAPAISSGPPAVTTQPVSRSVAPGETATFSVAATGTAPLSYQWQKNGANIPGASGSAYTTPAVTLSDNNAQFRCVVSNSEGSAISSAATLTVTEATAVLTASPNPLDFGDQATGTPATRALTLSNTGNVGLAVSRVVVGGGTGDFSYDGMTSFSLSPGASLPLNIEFQPTAVGTRSATLTVTHDGNNSPLVVNLAGTGFTSSGGEAVHRINGGGSAVTTSGIAWSADGYYAGSTRTYSAAKAIAGTTDDVLYQTERYGRTMSYSLPVAPGTYAVDLHFAELYFTTAGSRVFDVDVENGQG
ncbi:Putative Ig domain-containing protein, partial [Desulfococcus multivorans DSM 2059]